MRLSSAYCPCSSNQPLFLDRDCSGSLRSYCCHALEASRHTEPKLSRLCRYLWALIRHLAIHRPRAESDCLHGKPSLTNQEAIVTLTEADVISVRCEEDKGTLSRGQHSAAQKKHQSACARMSLLSMTCLKVHDPYIGSNSRGDFYGIQV